MSPFTYSLTFSEDKKNWSLNINGTQVITAQTTIMTKPSIVKLFSTHGNGELMPDGISYCPTPDAYKNAFDTFVEIATTLKK